MKTIFATTTLFFLPQISNAHVKWFSRSSDPTIISFTNFNTQSFWFLLVLSVVALALVVYLDRILESWKPFVRFNTYLESYGNHADVILRVFTGAALLLSWQAGAMIAPELQANDLVGWIQFFLSLCLLTAATTPIAGIGMIALYLYGISSYGIFHMLDYLVYPAIGYFLIMTVIKNQKLAQTKIPVLYFGLGFSLLWAALEKLYFPHWGLDVLRQQPNLSMGLPHDFFLMACAFIELCLGYLLIIGLLQRPLSIIITLVFVTTSAFFGKTEVIGHTILHGALLVFAVLGPGSYYPTPIKFHHRLVLRSAFATLNFVLLVGFLGVIYYWLATA